MDSRRAINEVNGVRSRVDQETYGDPENNTGGSVPADVESPRTSNAAYTPESGVGSVTLVDSETGSGVLTDDLLDEDMDDEDLMEQAATVRGSSYVVPDQPPERYGVNESDEDVSPEVRAARAEIEQTRADLSSTIDEIKDRLSPAHLMEEAKEAAVGKVEDAVESVKETAGTVFEAAREKASDVFHAAKDKAADAVEAVKDMAHSATEKVSEKIDDLRSHGSHGESSETLPSVTYYSRENLGMGGGSSLPSGLRSTGEIIVETIRVNPIPAAIAGFGIGWLLLSIQRQRAASESYDNGYAPSDYYRDSNGIGSYNGNSSSPGLRDRASQLAHNVGDKASDIAHSVGDRASGLAHSVSDKASDVAHSVGDKASTIAHTVGDRATDFAHTVGDKASDFKDRAGQFASGVKDRAGDLASSAKDRAGDFADMTKTQYRAASDGVQTFVDEQPLATAAIALVVGAAVGLLIPASSFENKIAGPQRDRLMDQAGDAFQNVSSRVQNVAQVALGQARDSLSQTVDQVGTQIKQTVEQTKDTVRTEAQNQGLTSPAMANA